MIEDKTMGKYFTDKQKVVAVRQRLAQWQDYYEKNAHSTPNPAYNVTDKVADAIYQARQPAMSNSLPDPKLNLNVADEVILMACERVENGEKYVFF
ncbi:hypothetical protein HY485_01280 [Candidatus Woesearchaeota archaeon]|nr:hypothetical protein [Candidatus Woesearchaeota archaeon]